MKSPQNMESSQSATEENHEKPERTPNHYPMGALKAWFTVAGAFLLQLCAVGPVTSFGVFQEFYTTTWLTKYSASDISWIGSVQLFLELGFGVVGGRLYDAGYCRATLLVGSVVFAFSFFMLSLVQEEQYYQAFLSQGIGMGIGLSLIFIPTCTLVSHHFKMYKALAMGILVASAPLGGLIFSIMLNQLIHSDSGFQWGVRASAFVVAGCLVIGNALISIPPQVSSTSIPRKTNSSGAHIQDWPYLLTLLSGFMAQLGTYFPLFYVQLFAENRNVSKTLTFYSLAIMNIASIFGRVIPNYFADRWGAINIFILCVALNGLVGFAMLGCGTVSGLVLFCIFYGFFFGSTISLYLPVVTTLAPQQADMGKTMGVAIAPVGLASLIGPPIVGAILGNRLVWWRGITFASLSLTSASVIQLIARQLHVKRSKLEHCSEKPA
ncbi:MFS general substrate transporter [Crucibulum laeve]|uniref:MFS general substrate transporter n=1 Tax=Crucibulum laeve TaxID=68775 RepID=A0A5C3M1J9_9AGAR|nr:MFS general substrate transporter [Crucibulum laeve]